MRPSFGARRKPRKIGQNGEDSDGDTKMAGVSDDETGTGAAPLQFKTHRLLISWLETTSRLSTTSTSKFKKRSSLRVSFGPGGTSMTEEDDSESSVVFTPKKSNLSRQAIEKNAFRKSIVASRSLEHPIRQNDDRPSYNADYLNELKSSTPSTPKDLRSRTDIEDDVVKALDLASKFGTDVTTCDFGNSIIPTDAEISEKKERRARLAKQNFIALSDEEEDNFLSREKRSDTRLVRDDEDFAEGFDEFVEDSRVALGRKAEREQERKHEAEIRQLIQEAEGSSGESDDSEAERRAAYEAAQTRAGMDGIKNDSLKNSRERRQRTPPKITPLPSLKSCLERLQVNLKTVQSSRERKIRKMGELQKEKQDIGTREAEIQQLLKEVGENYEKLRAEAETPVEERANASDEHVRLQGVMPTQELGNNVGI